MLFKILVRYFIILLTQFYVTADTKPFFVLDQKRFIFHSHFMRMCQSPAFMLFVTYDIPALAAKLTFSFVLPKISPERHRNTNKIKHNLFKRSRFSLESEANKSKFVFFILMNTFVKLAILFFKLPGKI